MNNNIDYWLRAAAYIIFQQAKICKLCDSVTSDIFPNRLHGYVSDLIRIKTRMETC